jgi:hypothetical protein
MQRKQQVGECCVCVILFAEVVVYVLHRACKGFEGGLQGKHPREIFFPREMCCIFASFFVALIFMSIVGRFFGTWFFLLMVFYLWLRN